MLPKMFPKKRVLRELLFVRCHDTFLSIFVTKSFDLYLTT